LKKVAVSGGPPLTLCAVSAASALGASWNRDGTILFSNQFKLYRVADAGGAPTLLLAPDKKSGYVLPQFLPDGRHFIFVIGHQAGGQTIAAGSLGSKEITRLMQAGSNALYAPPGRLLYLNRSTLMARPFDAKALHFTGQAVPVAENVGEIFGILGDFSVSPSGVLAYRTAAGETEKSPKKMAWFNSKGKELGTVGQPGVYTDPALSPDATKLAVGVGEHMAGDLWVYDLKRGTASRLTFNPAGDEYPVWSADGKRIFFTSHRLGKRDIYQKSANGLGSTQQVLISKQPFKDLDDLSPDGRYAIYDTGPGGELWVLPLFGEKKPSVFIPGKFAAKNAKISPDGRYVAYESNETGRREIYVQTFPNTRANGRSRQAAGRSRCGEATVKNFFI
jgi:eukaryotic-like serine/threonine-protein kinase